MTRTVGPELTAGWAVVALVAAALCLGACSTPDTGPRATVTAEAPGASLPIDHVEGDLGLAKRHFRAAHYGLAEVHFRRAAETGRRGDPEAWLGLAASYDKLKRYDLADRAYDKVVGLFGATPEYLNNRGYSYLLRGDVERASGLLAEAAIQDPENERVLANLAMLEGRRRGPS